MQLAYIARRFGVFLLIVWLAASLNFFLPRLSGQDPVRTKLLQSAQLGGCTPFVSGRPPGRAGHAPSQIPRTLRVPL